MRWLPLLLIVACAPEDTASPWGPASSFADVLPSDGPLTPPGVPPVLSVTPLPLGRPATWTVTDLDPNEWVYVGRSVATGGARACPPALGGACLDLRGNVEIHARVRANAAGVATFTTNVPDTAPAGLVVRFQAAAIRGPGGADSVISNMVAETTYEPFDTFAGSPGLLSRPSNPTCVAPARPATTFALSMTRVYPSVSLTVPTTLVQPPGDNTVWYVGEQGGIIKRFPNVTNPSTTTAMNLTPRVVSGGELGLLGMTFHPEFPTQPYLYVSYTGGTRGSPISRISRFTTSDGGLTFTVGSEVVLMSVNQPASNHNGGNLMFGPDGYLYWGLGDGGSANDPWNNAQNTNNVLGGMVRIDVNGAGYTIPADNPFAGGGGAPELWAWGLRNPYRWSFDRLTGDLWAGDVGQDAFEEIDVVVAGGNYGWRPMEANQCVNPPGCNDPSFIPPVHAYAHGGGSASVIGGFVYRGTAIPRLYGAYLFAEFYSGQVTGLFPNGQGGLTASVVAQRAGLQAATFAEDQHGEIYVMDYAGRIDRLTAAAPGGAAFPARLSQTGCVDPANPQQPASGLIPYTPRVELHADGLDKRRFLALPNGTEIGVQADGDFDLPIGTVLVKELSWQGDPVETRLFMRHADGDWGAYTYVWNAQGTDADLVVGGLDVALPGGPNWHVPDQGECFSCHTSAAGRSLGLEVAQLNQDQDYSAVGGSVGNQLDTFDSIDLLTDPLPDPATLAALATLGGGGTDAEQARSYLHANCAHCHRPGGGALGGIDLRWSTPYAATNLCNVVPSAGNVGVAGARNVLPGDHARSVLWLRMVNVGAARMPTLGSDVVHQAAADVVADWIDGQGGCP